MSITYKDAGVDKEAGYKQVGLIKEMIRKTHSENVISDIGGFSGLFSLDKDQYKDPVLVSGTDGVGTKLKLAFMTDRHDTIGEDCVAMCVNDILCQGAQPLFFLDYIATGKLLPEKMAEVVEGVANGCIKGGAALIGGETAEMPGFYKEDEYDLAGFAVGVVDREKIIDGSRIEEGDIILGLPSSGLHSNGYSLVRKIVFDKMGYDVDTYIDGLGRSIGEELLTPTRIYTRELRPIIEKHDVKGLIHITGGGFYENIPRIMKDGLTANIDRGLIKRQPIFDLLMEWGGISEEEMYSTFNMGVGMVVIIGKEDLVSVKEILDNQGEDYYILGAVTKGDDKLKLC